MTALALGLLLGPILAAPSFNGVLALGDRTEARTRSGYVDGVDLENAPTASVSLTGVKSSYSIGYGPRFVYFDIFGTRDLTVSHAGGLRAAFTLRRLSLSFTVDGSIGKVNTAGLLAPISLGLGPAVTVAPQPPPQQTPDEPEPEPMGPPTSSPGGAPTVQPTAYLLPPGILYIGGLRFGANVGYAFTPRWTTSANASFGMAGGIDFASQQIAPPNRNLSLGLGLSYALSRTDALTTSVFGSYTWVLAPLKVEGDPRVRFPGEYRVFGITEGYSHSVTRRTSLSVGGGLNFVNAETGGDSTNSVNGTAFGGLGHTIPLSGGAFLQLSSAAALGAFYNPVVGAIQQTLSLSGGASWSYRKWSAGVSGGAASSIPFDENTTRTVTGGANVGYAPTTGVALASGVRVATQAFPSRFAADVPAQWVAFVSLTLTAPVIRF